MIVKIEDHVINLIHITAITPVHTRVQAAGLHFVETYFEVHLTGSVYKITTHEHNQFDQEKYVVKYRQIWAIRQKLMEAWEDYDFANGLVKAKILTIENESENDPGT